MDNKTQKELGFSMNEINENTILIEGVVQGNVSKRSKIKHEREFSKISLHLFDREYIEKFQEIEINITIDNRDLSDRLSRALERFARFLMK